MRRASPTFLLLAWACSFEPPGGLPEPSRFGLLDLGGIGVDEGLGGSDEPSDAESSFEMGQDAGVSTSGLDASASQDIGASGDLGPSIDAGSGAGLDAGTQTGIDGGMTFDSGVLCPTIGGPLRLSQLSLMSDVQSFAPAGASRFRPAYYSADGRRFYVAIEEPALAGGSNFELWTLSRANTNLPFGAPLRTNLDTSQATSNRSSELALSFVSSTSLFWFTQIDNGQSRVRSTETNTGPADFFPDWIEEASGFPDGPQDYLGAAVSADGRSVISSRRPAGRRFLVEYVRSSPTALWSLANTLSAVAGASGDDLEPWLSPDGRLLLFASNRGGQFDLYYACRATGSAPFSAAVSVPLVNTFNSDERSPVMSADAQQLFFSQESLGGGFSEQLFRATP